jgi:hypothetical protein
MAVVQGIREKVHLPLYDSVSIEPRKQLVDVERSSTLRFFVNVQNKTKLETNLQSASLLPHYNTFEARAMRVVISDLPPQYPGAEDSEKEKVLVTAKDDDAFGVSDDDGAEFDVTGATPPGAGAEIVVAEVEIGLDEAMELLKEARESEHKETTLDIDSDSVTLIGENGTELTAAAETAIANGGGMARLGVKAIEAVIEKLEKRAPPRVQLRPHDGAGTVIGKLIYNTVTTFYVGEKVMISMPTWFFPGGAGEYSGTGKFTTNGEPSPLATFRFAEPIYIDRQQNFRVEIEIPESDVLKDLQKLYGPLSIWVVLDGYMTRGVQ